MATGIRILVGTMTGTAGLCADEMCDALLNGGYRTELLPMDKLDATIFVPSKAYIICTSTYGHGDVPDNAKKLYNSLMSQNLNLKGVYYGIFALGDITHKETFCWGGINFDKALRKLQAGRVGEIFKHDATSGELPEDIAGVWAVHWAKLLTA